MAGDSRGGTALRRRDGRAWRTRIGDERCRQGAGHAVATTTGWQVRRTGIDDTRGL